MIHARQVHLKAATLKLHPGNASGAQQAAGGLSFQGSSVQNVPERVRLEARMAYESAQLPAPVQARVLEVPAGQLECPLVASRLLNVRASPSMHENQYSTYGILCRASDFNT